jgi:hypothetical protein
MESHDGRWPSSWEDLLSVMNTNSENQVMFRGASAGDTNYAFALREKVAINWKFNPAGSNQVSPVTRLDGTKFPVVWQGAEPNGMVRLYLRSRRANTNAAQSQLR